MTYRNVSSAIIVLFFTLSSSVGAAQSVGNFGAGQVDIPGASFETDPGKRWAASNRDGKIQYVWDRTVAHTGRASLKVGQTGGGWGGLVQQPCHYIPVNPGDLIEARVWAKTESATGKTYLSVDWFQGGNMVGQTNGGSIHGHVTWRLNPIRGTNDWMPLYARAFVPDDADRVRIGLHSEANQGWAWFDDVALRIVPDNEIRGELDKNSGQVAPERLTPNDYVTVKDGHLWYQGKRLRLWGAQGNLLAVTHADIDFEVERFAEHGFRCFRTLWWGREVTDDYAPGDLSWQDRADYLLARLGHEGVFVWFDILNSCQIRPDLVNVIDDLDTADQWRQAVSEWVESGRRDYINIRSAYAAPWDPRIQQIYHNYIRKVLAHRNLHNGLTYAEDPTFFTWELTNEEWWIMRILWGNHLQLPDFFQKELYDQWNEWLRQGYGDTARLSEAWEGLLPGESLEAGTVLLLPLLGKTDAFELAQVLGLDVKYAQPRYGPDDFAKQRGADVVEFLTKLHIAYKNEAAEIFRSQGRPGLGCQIVPLVYDTGYSGAILPFYMHSFGDAIAAGSYQDMSTHDPSHPTFPFASGLTSPPFLNGWLTTRRVKDKPAFVYENMIFNPQKYKAEWFYRLLAWAAIQDVDVIDFHYYGHPLPFPGAPNPYGTHPVDEKFHMRNDEVLMAAVRTAGEIFKRGYLKPAANPTTVTLGSNTLWSLDGIYGGKYAPPGEPTAFRQGFQWAFNPQQASDTVDGPLVQPEQEAMEPVVRPTDQITYRWQEGIMVIDDPRAKVLVGFVPRSFKFNDGLSLRRIHVNTPEGMPFVIPGERYVAFGIVSLDEQPLAESTSILVSVVNTSFPEGFTMDLEKMAQDTRYAYGLRDSITSWGDNPVLVGRVGMVLEADWLAGRRYRMIDYNNNVLVEGTLTNPRLIIPDDLPVYIVQITRP